MNPDDRMEIFISAVIAAAFGISFLDLPKWIMDIIVGLGPSFVISGIFWVMLKDIGLEFLEDIKVAGGFVSLMTILVFLLKEIILPSL